VHLDTILGLIAEREAAARQTAEQVRAQITTLTSELTRIDAELADLVATRNTLRALAAAEFTADDPIVISSAYQQILAVLGAATTGMRAKDICLALDIEPLPKHVEGTRAKLKRLVSRKILTENEPGVFALIPKRT
jgi:chorismate mutase